MSTYPQRSPAGLHGATDIERIEKCLESYVCPGELRSTRGPSAAVTHVCMRVLTFSKGVCEVNPIST